MLIARRPSLIARLRGSRALAASAGVGAAFSLFLIAVWAITGHGYYWLIWPMLAIALVLAVLAVKVAVSPRARPRSPSGSSCCEHAPAR